MLPTYRPPTHPGEMLLREFLDPLFVSQVEAARRMNIPFQILSGEPPKSCFRTYAFGGSVPSNAAGTSDLSWPMQQGTLRKPG